ncbi:DUF6597 domain-containing transcriptional factor [Paenibacillus chungangensis]|uniref:DUF6597 domain-containing transcriptional factor n=1 Tax=Paenibacillus chungangensis TaxID=696535 RepID=A0ABW3HVE4_9BACL
MTVLFRPVQSPTMHSEIQLPGYSYREYRPSGRLAAYVACYWSVDFDPRSGMQSHRIIPDGCVDIIVDRTASSSSGAAFAAGLMTTYHVLDFAEEQSSFGIRMFLESARSLLRIPVSELTGGRVYLEELWGMEGRAAAERLLLASDVPELIELAERLLTARLSRWEASATPGLVQHGLYYMYDANGALSLSELADKLGYSERHLRRVFEQELGVGLKELVNIIRFQSLLRGLRDDAYASYAELAVQYGYYDQSHMTGAFKRYYGKTPTQVWRRDEKVSD